MASATSIRLKLLGGFELRRAEGPVIGVSAKKARALLAYLALAVGRAHGRDRLADLLWSDRSDKQARDSLRQAIAELRQALSGIQPAPLTAEHDLLVVDQAVIEVDAMQLQALADSDDVEALRRAAALYDGDLLDGLDVHSPAFEDWLRHERQRYRELAVEVLKKLLRCETGTGKATVAHRLLVLDPLQEEGHRAVMRLHAEAGDIGAALRQYELCHEMLGRELGVTPSPETEALHRRIRQPPIEVPRSGEKEATLGAPAVSPRIEMSGQAKPSLAVLPFVNLSADPTQQYLSDGITEDIITELSRYRELLVIARHSSFRYRDKSHDMKRVGQELGVEYLVDGSLRKAGDRLRVTAQLIEAATGIHLWAERYDRELADIFAVQDEVSQTVASTLVGQIERSHADRARRRPTESWAAYDYVLQAREHALQYDTQTAETLLNRAIEMDPRYALAFGRLARVHLVQYFDDLQDENLQKALSAAQKGLSLDDEDPCCQCAAGAVHIWFRRFELAEMHFDRAVALNPNSADFIMMRAVILARVGRTTEALAALDMGALRDPHLPPWYWETRSVALFVERRYDDVIRSQSHKNPLQYYDHAYLAASYAYLGRDHEARAAAAEVLRLRPGFSIRLYSKQEPYKDPADLEHLLQGFHKAGLPE